MITLMVAVLHDYAVPTNFFHGFVKKEIESPHIMLMSLVRCLIKNAQELCNYDNIAIVCGH